MVDRNLDVLLADANAYMASSRRYPNVSAGLDFHGQQEDRANDYTSEYVDGQWVARERGWQGGKKLYYNFSINQPIWHWGILEAASKTGKIGQEIAKRNYAEAYRRLALDVRAAYLQLILSKMAARNNAFVSKLAQDNLKRQESRFAANQITMGEILGVRLAADEASLAHRRAVSDLDFVLRNFRRLTGFADFDAADIPDSIPGVEQTPVMAPPAENGVLLESNAFRIGELELKRAKLDYRSARFNRYPRLNSVAGLTQDEISYTADIGQKYQVETAFVGIQVSWNIFDGPNTKGQKLAGLTRIRQAERALDNLRESLRQTADTEATAVTFAWEAARNSAMRFRFAREGYIATRDNFARGQASQEQVDMATAAQYNAEYNYESTLVAFLNAAAQYSSTLRADPYAKSPVQP